MSKHPHAELMAQYAQDALETDKPWKMWQYRWALNKPWEYCEGQPMWQPDYEYRRRLGMKTETPTKYVHRYTHLREDNSVEVVESMLNATHISIYMVDEEGHEQWVHDVELPETLLAIFNTHQTAVELYNQL